ncbi:MAG TPA: hypothetical protein VFY29_13970 [Terriglobia bacterium]|nr:hypothetical protein [Terriglobia bacterium]
MKNALVATLFIFVVALALEPAAFGAASIEIAGKWSGGWTPEGGVRDSVTVEFDQENGKVTGRFVTPQSMPFTMVSVNLNSGAVSLEAKDAKSGKLYRIEGKVEGTELKGTLKAGDVQGQIRLIKWTYVPR